MVVVVTVVVVVVEVVGYRRLARRCRQSRGLMLTLSSLSVVWWVEMVGIGVVLWWWFICGLLMAGSSLSLRW